MDLGCVPSSVWSSRNFPPEGKKEKKKEMKWLRAGTTRAERAEHPSCEGGGEAEGLKEVKKHEREKEKSVRAGEKGNMSRDWVALAVTQNEPWMRWHRNQNVDVKDQTPTVGETKHKGKKKKRRKETKNARPEPSLLLVTADTIVWAVLTFPKCHSRPRHGFGGKNNGNGSLLHCYKMSLFHVLLWCHLRAWSFSLDA